MTTKKVECSFCGNEITKKNFDDFECIYVEEDSHKVFCSTACIHNGMEIPETFEELFELAKEDF